MKTIEINNQTNLGELVTYFPAITSRLNELHIVTEVQEAYNDFLNRPDKELPVSELY